MRQPRCEDVLRHADPFVCTPRLDDLSHHVLPPLRYLSPTRDRASTSFSCAYSHDCCTPNCRSNPIPHRVRRKRQRLPPSLLIENASNPVLASTRSASPRRFRSRLATSRPSVWPPDRTDSTPDPYTHGRLSVLSSNSILERGRKDQFRNVPGLRI